MGGLEVSSSYGQYDLCGFPKAAAFCALARVHTLGGGHELAGGMQGACPPAVFDTLRADFGVMLEAFAHQAPLLRPTRMPLPLW